MTQSNLKFADHICQRMIANGMVKSQAEFSQKWLGRTASYLSTSKARQRNMSEELIKHLFDCVDVHVQNCRSHMTLGSKTHWHQDYERAIPIHAEVQSFLTWQASGHAAAHLSPNQITKIVQQIGRAAAQLHARNSRLANLIHLPMHRKTP